MSSPDNSISREAAPPTRAFAIASIASLCLSLVGALLLTTVGDQIFPAQRWWAFSFLTLVPNPLRELLAIITLSACAQMLLATRRTRLYVLYTTQVGVRIAGLIYVLGAGLLFWLLRERTFYGDALLKLHLLSTQTVQSDPYVWKEPLDSLLTYTLVDLLAGWGQPAQVAVALLSVCAGMVYVAAVLYVANLLSEYTSQFALYVVGLLALGASQLWFGHVENYSLVTACGFASIALAVGYLRDANPLWPVGLLAGLAVSFHPQALFLAPALLLLLDHTGWQRQGVVLLVSGLVAPLCTLLILVSLGVPWPSLSGGYAGDPQLFYTPRQIVAPSHLWDVLNNLLLVAPLALLWLGVGIWAFWQPDRRRDRTFHYLSAVAVGLLVYLVAFQNDLPRPQDWDLFAIVGPGLTLWGLYGWVHSFHAIPLSARHWFGRVALLPALTFATLFTVAWVGVNASYTLIRPNPNQRDLYAQYRLLDLTTLLPQATVTPPEPICDEPTGCERVALTEFTMPQDGDSRPTIFAHAPARIAMPLQVPDERTFLWLSPALDPTAWGWGGDGITFQVAVATEDGEELLWSRHLSPGQADGLDWQAALIALDAFRGQRINLLLITTPGPANNDAGDRAGWGLPWLMRGTPDVRYD